VPVLVDELLQRVRTSGDALLDAARVQGRRPTADELAHASNWLLEYRNILSGAGSTGADPGEAPVTVTTPLVVADELVRACCTEALDRLRTAIDDRRAPSREALPALATAVAEWTRTLVDLRDLDEGGLEGINL
jgi:hypothetical protein